MDSEGRYIGQRVGAKRGLGGKKGQERQRSIIEAASRLFADNGYSGTSLEDIASAVGLLKGSLYHYIDTKEDLLYQVLQEAHDAFEQNMERVMVENGTVVDKLRSLFCGHVCLVAATRHSGDLFQRNFLSLSEPRRLAIGQRRDVYDAYVRSLITEGQHLALFNRELDPKLASLGLIGMLNSVSRWYQETGSESAEQIADHLSDLAVRALR